MISLGIIKVFTSQYCYCAFSMTKSNVFSMEKPLFCKLKWRSYHGRFLHQIKFFYKPRSWGYKTVKRGLGLDYPF